MGRAKVGKPRRERPVTETHEPATPLPGWPSSHATSALTDAEKDECVVITIHGVEHYLHATTARELHESLNKTLVQYNAQCDAVGVPGA